MVLVREVFMNLSSCFVRLGILLTGMWAIGFGNASGQQPAAELIFPLHSQHNHAPGIAELKSGELIVSWYRGSGERTADDVAVWGSRLKPGSTVWSEAFLLADTPGFPDCNTALMTDADGRLFLFWPVIVANTWESCLTRLRVSDQPEGSAAPAWNRDDTILLKPEDFSAEAIRVLDETLALLPPLPPQKMASINEARERLSQKIWQRMGWQPRCKPTVLRSGRILLPLYTDTFSLSIMAISDDGGRTWFAGKPMLGFGAIQPTVLQKSDGTVVAWMRENGFTGHVRYAESTDEGATWGPVLVSGLPNPGSGLDGVRLQSGRWLLVHNDAREGRGRLAVSMSDDEGSTWKWKRLLEDLPDGSAHYPCVIQGRDGRIHVVYSYFVKEGKSMKHSVFTEAWVEAGAAGSDK